MWLKSCWQLVCMHMESNTWPSSLDSLGIDVPGRVADLEAEEQHLAEARRKDREERLEFKTKEILQNVENLQFTLTKESQKREEFEKTFHELKLGWDDKLVDLDQRHHTVNDRMDEIKVQVGVGSFPSREQCGKLSPNTQQRRGQLQPS